MNKKIIIITLSIIVVLMTVGYAIFRTSLNITGTANIVSTWNIEFTNIEKQSVVGGVTETNPPTARGTTATFNVDFKSPGDKIIYEITVENKGTLNAIVKEISASETGSDGIYFKISDIKKGDKLPSKSSQIITVEIGYSSEVTTQPVDLKNDLTLNVTFVQDVGQNIPSEDLNIEDPILTQVTGEDDLILENSVGRAISNYLIYGNSIQASIPDPNNYVEINSFGDNNIITIENLLNNKKVIIDLTGHEPLRKIGDIADYIDFANQRIVRNVGMYTFNGKEGWFTNKETNGSPNYFINQENFAKINGGKNCRKGITAPLLSTLFPYTNLGTDEYRDRKGTSIYGYYDNTACFIITNEFETNEEWSQYLKDKAQKEEPLTILYALETPIYEPITLPIIYTDTGNNKLNINSNISVSKVIIDYYKKRS